MSTGLDFITDALEELGWKAAERPIESEDGKVALKKFNGMMTAWEGSGILLGFTPIFDLADTVRIPKWAEDAVKVNLAGKLAAPFKMPITTELAASIRGANELLARTLVKSIDVAYPDTLPMGSGNQCYDEDEIFAPSNSEANF